MDGISSIPLAGIDLAAAFTAVDKRLQTPSVTAARTLCKQLQRTQRALQALQSTLTAVDRTTATMTSVSDTMERELADSTPVVEPEL
jgi:hypothetical protein